MKPIVIEVLFNTDITKLYEELDISCHIEDYEVKEITLFNIDVILPHQIGDKKYTLIISGGEKFICPNEYHLVQEYLSILLSDN